jgi:Fis family transcriptional regulator
VRKALDYAFPDLGDHSAGELYQLFLAEMEQPLLEKVMQIAKGNQTRAAEILGINRGTLRKKLVQYSLDK